jgi:hypothetical protein
VTSDYAVRLNLVSDAPAVINSARLADGRWFRTLTVLDLYTRELSPWSPIGR